MFSAVLNLTERKVEGARKRCNARHLFKLIQRFNLEHANPVKLTDELIIREPLSLKNLRSDSINLINSTIEISDFILSDFETKFSGVLFYS